MTLSCFIIDDEPLALGLIESYVRKTPFLALAGKFYSAVEAAGAVRDTPPDVIFLDIQMAEMNGMEFARIVPPQHSVVTPGAPASATSTSTMGVTTVHSTPELAIRRASWTHVLDMSR